MFKSLEQLIENLSLLAERDKLHHALLLSMPTRVNNERVLSFCKTLLCEQAKKQECGQCKSCLLFAAKSHVDFFELSPLMKKGIAEIISVDELRNVIDFAQIKPQLAKRRVILINDAHLLSVSAANALLKLLEEPNNDVYLLLVTSNYRLLPQTIISRCCVFELTNHGCIDDQVIEQLYLDLNGYLVEKNKDLLSITNSWAKINIDVLLDCLLFLLAEVIKAKHSVGENEEVRKLSNLHELSALWGILDRVLFTKKMLLSSARFSANLFIENLLIAWKGVRRGE